ncbi:MAG: excinuclease ABC subunit UvrA [Desulfobacterales bacterium]
MTQGMISIRGARHHNLKNIDLDLPRNRLIVITGLSGSGKSTLAFDTLYAEGQRRYVESLSAYARQFLERLEKPDVDFIDGLSPAIAIEQKTASHNPRSTVGTITEIHDYLRLLYARVGVPHCHLCGSPIRSQTLDQFIDQLLSLPDRTRFMVLSPLVRNRFGTHSALLKKLRRDGFARIRLDGALHDLDSIPRMAADESHTIEAVVDRLVVKEGVRNRLADSLELARSLSGGNAEVITADGSVLKYSEEAVCPLCDIGYPPFSPASFSFNSPHGACSACDGLGVVNAVDPDLVVPNPMLSLREGAVAPWANRSTVRFIEFLESTTRHFGTDIYTPFGELPEPCRKAVLFGTGDTPIRFDHETPDGRQILTRALEGVIPELERRYRESDSQSVREDIQQYMQMRPCDACKGARLNPASRSVRVQGLSLPELSSLPISKVGDFFTELDLEGAQKAIAHPVVTEILDRLTFLEQVGLSYLTLYRSAATLSGGESQRIRLATQIGSKLTGVLYVLDEPSIGLHVRDHQRLLESLIHMRNIGNTVLVVEHDEATIRAADHVVDMGPGAGMNGGEVVFSGPPERLLQSEASLTGQYVSGRKRIAVPCRRREGSGESLVLKSASENNLKGIDAVFPLGKMICVTGVSGSGKSTLILDTLYRALVQRLHHARIPAGACAGVDGVEHVDKVIHIDQSPIGKTPRSNPATYTGLFTPIRELFARTPEARMRGFRPGRFSFNVKGGRCEACSGDGILKIEMHFLPDIYVTCDTCGGKRYNRETLEIQYKGKNIDDIMKMTVNQAADFFSRIGAIRSKLETLIDVGLGYIHLGQPATTLSGGEAQRIKLSRELSKRETGRTVYILDEPTTGLHMDDIRRLLSILHRLTDAGNTVIIIEHHLDVIKTADHIIDMGPEGGEEGGWIVAAGTPEALTEVDGSHTGAFLKPYLFARNG